MGIYEIIGILIIVFVLAVALIFYFKSHNINWLKMQDKLTQIETITGGEFDKIEQLRFYKNLSENPKYSEYEKLIILHSADYCPYCVQFKPLWKELKKSNLSDKIKFIKINHEETPIKIIQTIPSIYKFNKINKTIEKFEEKRNIKNLTNWILKS